MIPKLRLISPTYDVEKVLASDQWELTREYIVGPDGFKQTFAQPLSDEMWRILGMTSDSVH